MKQKRNFDHKENVTKYGEFVCTAFEWLPISRQKEQAKRLEQLTREDDEIELWAKWIREYNEVKSTIR